MSYYIDQQIQSKYLKSRFSIIIFSDARVMLSKSNNSNINKYHRKATSSSALKYQ